MPRTKVVCTIGPVSRSPEVVRGLIRAGMDVARINFSHGDHADHAEAISVVREVAREEGQLVAVMADLQGPKLRVGTIEGKGINLQAGDDVVLVPRRTGAAGEIPIPHPDLLDSLRVGQIVLLDDGQLELAITKAGEGPPRGQVVVGGPLTSRKGVNVPGVDLSFSVLTPKDREDVAFALGLVDYVALSFVRRAADVSDLRQYLENLGRYVPIIAKIEKPEALDVFDEILAEADGVMVARGDLGVETPAEEVPFHQKRIIGACNRAGKPVITATQMLQTMIDNPRPTRAEASDIFNAVLDGTDAVMLSGETAIGRYPVQAAETMETICANAESRLPYGRLLHGEPRNRETITGAISLAAVEIAVDLGARAIITATRSGATARMVARHRPAVPILAVTPNTDTLHQLALVWGVIPALVREFSDTDRMMQLMVQAAVERNLAGPGDQVVLTAGTPWTGGSGETDLLKVQVVEG